jgi:hypothetical protein
MRTKRPRAMPRVWRVAPPILLALLFCAGPGLAAPAPPSSKTSRRAIVEVIQLPDGKSKSRGAGAGTIARRVMRFTVAVAGDGRPSRVETQDGSTSYRLTVSQRPQKGSTAEVRLDLRCWASGARRGKRGHSASSTTEVSLSSRVRLGRRVLLGRIERAGGGELQLAVLLEES